MENHSNSTKLRYGTAGFRALGEEILKITHRIATAVCVISSKEYNGKTIGIIITASHNPKEYNGIKLVDPEGEILPFLENLVNCDNSTHTDYLENIKGRLSNKPSIIIGMDPRPSSTTIKNKLIESCKIFDADIVDMGITTTPELHLLTCNPDKNYVPYICKQYIKMIKGEMHDMELVVDCANGAGYKKMRMIKLILNPLMNIELINTDSYENINEECGADFVMSHEYIEDPAEDLTMFGNIHEPKIYASLDGDADRLIISYNDEENNFNIVNGDKLALIFLTHINDILEGGGINGRFGFIHTVYTNHAILEYIYKKLHRFTPEIQPVGVKNLHSAAKKYNIGIYFEPNGHGTVLFNATFIQFMKILKNSQDIKKKTAAKSILNIYRLLNQKVGDGITNLLMILYICRTANDIVNMNNMFSLNPHYMAKIIVKNPDLLKISSDEKTVLEPPILMRKINEKLSRYNNSRVIIRRSGTEKDCIRLYVETCDKNYIDEMLEVFSNLITQYLD